MKNQEKDNLKREVYRLFKVGYKKKEAIKILVSYGYAMTTASKYWEIFTEEEEKCHNK